LDHEVVAARRRPAAGQAERARLINTRQIIVRRSSGVDASSGDGMMFIIDQLMLLGALIVSYLYFNKTKSNENTLLHSSGIRSGRASAFS
jgi:hypothetical protein